MKEFVNNKVQVYRRQAKITQEELAAGVGVTRQTIIAIEHGNYTPSVLLALKIAQYFKVSLDQLFYITYEKNN
jgi:putative transcriptional regulator